ncbi:hypothetical protein [Polaribacter sp. AHE13PA]|uniref:hypothetical protein n=1 Tax=Polaribacter sp. AHE13PA TaxID=2745562 RepID=UPI001C500AF5|nr:hypothetical protein [Polaribacter sp. AHE13PA]QXP65959.1 hypothetical protein H0I28_12250 [Polaribacter sp. AHE13PA]
MKLINKILIIAILTIVVGCSEKESKGRFNYPMIKSKIALTEEQTTKFDKITTEYTEKAKQAWLDANGNKEAALAAQKIVFAEQDAKIKAFIEDKQYATYFTEVNIERGGREKYNMSLIKKELDLDSLQSVKYDAANETFFTVLRDNHDNYHGKLDVYMQYHKEIDVSRRAAFKKMMTEEQFDTYLKLVDEYKVGKIEE